MYAPLFQITWLRRRDWHILSSNLQLYIQDERFEVTHLSTSDEWNLRINPVRHSDSGSYECQVSVAARSADTKKNTEVDKADEG